MEGNKIKAKIKPKELMDVSFYGLVPAIKNQDGTYCYESLVCLEFIDEYYNSASKIFP